MPTNPEPREMREAKQWYFDNDRTRDSVFETMEAYAEHRTASLRQQLDAAREREKILRTALEHYADKSSWQLQTNFSILAREWADYTQNGYTIATAALTAADAVEEINKMENEEKEHIIKTRSIEIEPGVKQLIVWCETCGAESTKDCTAALTAADAVKEEG